MSPAHPAPLPRGGRGLFVALLGLVALLLAGPALAQTFPKFTGLVTDAANVLPAERKAALEAKLEALQQQTNHQLVVASIPDLQGYEIADYGYRLGRQWGVGLKGADNGAILIVAPKERKVRIEVGYGLEPIVTDALSSVIIQSRILPAFKNGDMPGGIEAGVDALAAQLRLPDDQARAKAAAAAKEYDRTHRRASGGGGFPISVIFWLALFGVILFASTRGQAAARRRRYRSGGGSDWPIWLWAASEIANSSRDRSSGGSIWGGGGGGSGWGSGGSDGSWGGGGFTGGGGGSFGGGGASGDW